MSDLACSRQWTADETVTNYRLGLPKMLNHAREIPLTAVRIVCGFASENQRDKQMNGRSLLGFCLYVPRDREGGATLAGTDQAAFLQGFHRIAISRCGAHDFIILQAAQEWVTTERIRLKLVSMLHVPNQILLCLREFRQNCPSLLVRHNATSQEQGEVYAPSSVGPAAPARSWGRIFSTLNLPARSRMVFSTCSRGGGSFLIHRRVLMRATTNDRKYGLTRPRSFSFFTTAATFSSKSSTKPARF